MQGLGNIGDGITTGTKVRLHRVIEAVFTLGGCPAYRVRYNGGATGAATHGPATIIEPATRPALPPGGQALPGRRRGWRPPKARAAAHRTRGAELPR